MRALDNQIQIGNVAVNIISRKFCRNHHFSRKLRCLIHSKNGAQKISVHPTPQSVGVIGQTVDKSLINVL